MYIRNRSDRQLTCDMVTKMVLKAFKLFREEFLYLSIRVLPGPRWTGLKIKEREFLSFITNDSMSHVSWLSYQLYIYIILQIGSRITDATPPPTLLLRGIRKSNRKTEGTVFSVTVFMKISFSWRTWDGLI